MCHPRDYNVFPKWPERSFGSNTPVLRYSRQKIGDSSLFLPAMPKGKRTPETVISLTLRTATAGSNVVQSGRPIFDDFFQHLWPYIGNNTANVVFQMVKRLWLIRIDQ
ncbi:hypothetical protein TNCV_1421481 [Trichonephila clavipes]|nr:hypothetical protein TNCV_1421481 [Trichonephila clavipes]